MLLLVLFTSNLWAATSSEVAEPQGYLSPGLGFSNLGTNMVGTSATEMSCLMKRADPKCAKGADSFAKGLENALKKVKFPPNTFSRTALLHFLSQVIYESDHLSTTEQRGKLKPDQKGWGMIQVTGPANIKACSSCMDECDPGAGSRVLKGKLEKTIGNKAPDRTDAALISLCWWKSNMTQNMGHARYANAEANTSSRAVTQIVNAGGVGKAVTDGEKSLGARQDYFKELKAADDSGACRHL